MENNIPLIILVLWWGSVACSSLLSISLIIIYICRVLGFRFCEGTLYHTKLDFELCFYKKKTKHGKYERRHGKYITETPIKFKTTNKRRKNTSTEPMTA